MQKLKALKTVDQGLVYQHVLKAPGDLPALPDSGETMAIPVMKRREGVMVAIPVGFFPTQVLEEGNAAVHTDMLGPSTQISLPAVIEEEDGSETAAGYDVDVLLVDFSLGILDNLRLYDPVTEEEGIHSFCQGSPEIYPAPQQLLEAASRWIQTAAGDRVGFYTALEEELMRASPTASAPAPKRGAKKITTAALAEQVTAIAEALPAVLDQLRSLQANQEKLEGIVTSAGAQAKIPPYRQPFGLPSSKAPALAASRFLHSIGPPPKVRPTTSATFPGLLPGEGFPGEEPNVLPSEEGYQEQIETAGVPEASSGSVQQLLLQQSQALTALVAHISSQDGLQDLGAPGMATAISLKGSGKRERVLNNLATRKGNFMLKVAQNAHRRLKPSDPLPRSLEDFGGKPLFAKYLERHGGYSSSRDLGLVMWLLCQVADQMIQGDSHGAMEMMALVLASVEQAAQDGGKWEVAWLLSLQEDPPPEVFTSRPHSSNPRLRAFAPLCPADWAATSLSYVKELDIINTRRQEAIPGKKSKKDEDKDPAQPRRPPRTPKKPKGASKGEEA